MFVNAYFDALKFVGLSQQLYFASGKSGFGEGQYHCRIF